jgi:hypothetical protein
MFPAPPDQHRADTAEEAGAKGGQCPSHAAQVEAEGVVKGPCSGVGGRHDEGGGDQHEVVLKALFRVPDAVGGVDCDHRCHHHRDDRSGGDGREQAKGQQQSAAKLGASCRDSVPTGRPQAHFLEGCRRALDTGTAEGGEELLGAMADEEQADNES